MSVEAIDRLADILKLTQVVCCACFLQSVTGAKFADDVNSYWLVKGAHGKQCPRGWAPIGNWYLCIGAI